MSDLQSEKDFFHNISPRIIDLVLSYGEKLEISTHKSVQSDFATEIDIAVEKLIITELRKLFPTDQIMAEESLSDTVIGNARIWIIDPICGTSNVSRGIKFYCTNIALAVNGELIAACVIDHCQANYVWSIGGNELYINDQKYTQSLNDESVNIDVDFGGLPKTTSEAKKKHISAVQKLLLTTDYKLLSFNTSLSVLYLALGKLDGVVFPDPHPWDIAAGSFLIQQSGGRISDLSGAPWTLGTRGTIAARNNEVYRALVGCYK